MEDVNQIKTFLKTNENRKEVKVAIKNFQEYIETWNLSPQETLPKPIQDSIHQPITTTTTTPRTHLPDLKSSSEIEVIDPELKSSKPKKKTSVMNQEELIQSISQIYHQLPPLEFLEGVLELESFTKLSEDELQNLLLSSKMLWILGSKGSLKAYLELDQLTQRLVSVNWKSTHPNQDWIEKSFLNLKVFLKTALERLEINFFGSG